MAQPISNVRLQHNFRVTLGIPTAVLTLLGLQLDSVQNTINLMVNSVSYPSRTIEKVEIPTANSSIFEPGKISTDGNLTLQQMQISSKELNTNPLLRIGVNELFSLWQACINFEDMPEGTFADFIGLIQQSIVPVGIIQPGAFDAAFGPGRGNLASDIKGTVLIEQLNPNQGQAVSARFFYGAWPVMVKEGDNSRSEKGSIRFKEVELSVDGEQLAKA